MPSKRSATIDPETLRTLRDAARELLSDEDRRSDSLTARGTALTGFVGVVLSLSAAVVGTLGLATSEARLDRWATAVVGGLLTSALVSLMAAVGIVVWTVIRPFPGTTISLGDTERWTQPEFTQLEAVVVYAYLTNGYRQALRSERHRNNRKARWLTRAYLIVSLGLAFVAVSAALAIVDRYVIG